MSNYTGDLQQGSDGVCGFFFRKRPGRSWEFPVKADFSFLLSSTVSLQVSLAMLVPFLSKCPQTQDDGAGAPPDLYVAATVNYCTQVVPRETFISLLQSCRFMSRCFLFANQNHEIKRDIDGLSS